MTILRFFTDPHIGKELKANTTPASRTLLSQQLTLHALQAATMPHPEGKRVEATICGGDLFDQDTNPEHILLAGAKVAQKCTVVLGGNHDVVNIKGRESSLSALAELTEDERFIMPPGPGYSSGRTIPLGDVDLHVIPHHSRQQEFDKALESALEMAGQSSSSQRNILLVHCNYNLTFEAGENDLNLTDAKARQLLRVFDYIVMGHDHRPRWECDDRLLILGNTHPTSFSDLGEKYVWFYDSESNTWHREVNAADQLMVAKASELIDDWKLERMHEYAGAEWIDIVGELPPEAAADLAKAIRQLWKENEYLYAVRASKVLFRAEGESNEAVPEAAQKTLIEIVEEQLAASPDLLALFREAKDMKE